MVTSNPDNVSFTKQERELVVHSLQLKAASVKRSERAATNDTVASAYALEYESIVALIAKFR